MKWRDGEGRAMRLDLHVSQWREQTHCFELFVESVALLCVLGAPT